MYVSILPLWGLLVVSSLEHLGTILMRTSCACHLLHMHRSFLREEMAIYSPQAKRNPLLCLYNL